MSAPVGVASDVRDACDCRCLVCLRENGTCGNGVYRRAFSVAIGVAVEAFLEQWHQIYEMVGETQILLGNLQLRHKCRL